MLPENLDTMDSFQSAMPHQSHQLEEAFELPAPQIVDSENSRNRFAGLEKSMRTSDQKSIESENATRQPSSGCHWE